MYDVNVIQGNRFTVILGFLPAAHLMLAMLYRVRMRPLAVVTASAQTILLLMIVLARTSALWLAMAVAFLAACLLLRDIARSKFELGSIWPSLVLVCGMLLLPLHDHLMLNAKFRDGSVQAGHVFWHNLISVLHNNPERIARYGIPQDIDPSDDRLGYFLFDREIAERGLDRSQFVNKGSDWIYRTSEPSLDFRWDKYDSVLRSLTLRTIAIDPWYALKSFAFFQPRAVFWVLLEQLFAISKKLLDASILFLLAGTWFARRGDIRVILGVTACLVPFSFLPAMVAAPFATRVADPFAGMVLLACVAAYAFVQVAANLSALIWSNLTQIGCASPCTSSTCRRSPR
jgi:hypothetical protein